MKDIDFENFEVENERAEMIRAQVEKIKGQELLGDLRLLCKELGYEDVEESSAEAQQSIPGFGKGLKEMLLEFSDVGTQITLRLELSANDLKVSANQQLACEVSFLPKDDDFVVTFVDEGVFNRLANGEDGVIEAMIKLAKRRKSERQKLWKDRFGKKKKAKS